MSDQPDLNSDQKECPYCGETIRSRAVVCRYCKSGLAEDAPTSDDVEDVVVTPMDRQESDAFILSQQQPEPAPPPPSPFPEYQRSVSQRRAAAAQEKAVPPVPPTPPRKKSCCSKTGCIVVLVVCAGLYFLGEIRDMVEVYRSDTPAGLVPEAAGRGPKKTSQQMRMNREIPPEAQSAVFMSVDSMVRRGLVSDVNHSANSVRFQESRWRGSTMEDKKYYLDMLATFFMISNDRYLGYRAAKIYSDRNDTLLAETGLWGTTIHE